MNWHKINVGKALLNTKSSLDGLSSKEAEKRISRQGKNEIPGKKRFTYLGVALDQFRSPMVYILLIAALISLALGELIDAAVILFAVIINTIVGFIQEIKAEKTLETLSSMIRHKAYVLRDGLEKELDSSEIVVGDILILKSGDRVPADVRIIESNELEVDEAVLTGESIPVRKIIDIVDEDSDSDHTKVNMGYMGSSVVRGRGKGLVVATGIKTRFGQIADILNSTEKERTPLQKQLDNFSNFFGKITFIILVFIIAIGLYRDIEFFDIFMTSVAIAVAAIPEGVLVAVTIILAIGMQRISKKGSLVRKLIAAETLGSVSIICTDKTGTLTKGEMQVDQVVGIKETCVLNGSCKKLGSDLYSDHFKALSVGMLCNNAVLENPEAKLEEMVIHGGYTEKAFLWAGLNSGIDFTEINNNSVRIGEIPFSSDRKFMATLNKEGKDFFVYVKGAAEEIINRSKYVFIDGKIRAMNERDLKLLRKKQNEMSVQGLRVLSVAFKKAEKDLEESFTEDGADTIIRDMVFVGLVALKDPLREETRSTIKLAKQAGIRTIMITGDNSITAKSIANELGMRVNDNNILEGEDLDQMKEKDFRKIVDKIKVYARVSPKHKSMIVDAWQARGEVVAMTGDGVNDSPALKSADVGVALGSGTEVAKQTADIVLLDNNFSTIINAVREGRVIFDNIRKVILYLISDSFSEVILVSGSLLIGLPIPFTAAQILWINLITDGLPNIALTLEPGEKGVMKQKPRQKNEPLINTEIKTLVASVSIVTGIIALILFNFIYNYTGDFVKASSITFSILAVDSLVYVFSTRSLRYSIFQKNFFSNKYLLLAVFLGFMFQILAIYHPFMQNILGTQALSIFEWSLVFCASLLTVFLIEIIKYIFISDEKNKIKNYALQTKK